METAIRKYLKQKDYQRHKLFRKMRRRRDAEIELAKDAPMKRLRRKLGIPKFEEGKDAKYLKYRNTLPDNLKPTQENMTDSPEWHYNTYRQWDLNGRPENFTEALVRGGMFSFEPDKLWHAMSVAPKWRKG